MSASNLLGATQFGGTLGEDNIFKAVGTVSLPIAGAGSTATTTAIPYLKANDLSLAFLVSGSCPVGPLVLTVNNPGLVNATLTITSTGAVAGVAAEVGYMCFAGRS